MVAFLLILIGLAILAFAAIPFSFTEGVLNTAITSSQWIINMICVGLSWVANIIGQTIVGILNFATQWLVSALASAGITISGFTQTWSNITFGFTLSRVNFSAMGYPTSFSPIGLFLSTWITDPTVANAVGALGMVILGALVFIVLVKTPKPRINLKNRQFGGRRSKGR